MILPKVNPMLEIIHKINQLADEIELEIVISNKESVTEKMKKINLSDHYASDEQTTNY